MNADRLLAHYAKIADTPDAIPRLRSFILELAVRGKLVGQNPNDEPVETLLERVVAKKEKQVKTGNIRSRVPVDIVKEDESPFGIPATWCWVRFGNIADFSAGRTPSRSEPSYWNSGDHPWVSIADIVDGATLISTKETVTEKAARQVFGVEPEQAGTIIMSFKLTIGKIGKLGIPAYHNEAIIAIRPYVANLDSYLFRALPMFARQGNMKGAIKGNTLNRKSISNILLPLPPLAEQHRIVAKFDELMDLCDRLETERTARETARDRMATTSLARLNTPDPDPGVFRNHASFAMDNLIPLTSRPDQIKALRQTILNLAVRGKLVEQDPDDGPALELLNRIAAKKVHLGVKHHVEPLATEEIPFNLPAGWHWSRIGELCTKTGSGSTPRGGRNVYTESGIPFIRSQNVYDDGLRLDDVAYVGPDIHARMMGTAVRARDLLLNITGGSMGRCCRVPDQFDEANVSQHVAIIRPAISEMADFLHKLVLSPCFQAFIFDQQTGAGRGGLPKKRMDRIAVVVPPLAEQHRIVAKVDRLMTLCDRLAASLTTGNNTRSRLLDVLLHEALSSSNEETRSEISTHSRAPARISTPRR